VERLMYMQTFIFGCHDTQQTDAQQNKLHCDTQHNNNQRKCHFDMLRVSV